MTLPADWICKLLMAAVAGLAAENSRRLISIYFCAGTLKLTAAMGALELIQINLLSPVVLAFFLGMAATLMRSDLKIPDELYQALSLYLLLAIGMKGGVELSASSAGEFLLPCLAALILGIAIPIWCYAILRRILRMSVADAAALAAHYGSVSAVTFLATLSFLAAVDVPHEGFLPALLAIMEAPAIVVALVIARSRLPGRTSWKEILQEILTGKSIVLLLGGLLIGYAVGRDGFAKVEPFFVAPFHGVLALFLLEMGMVAARRVSDLRRGGLLLFAFAIVMPLINGMIGISVGKWSGLSMGGSVAMGVLAASASYIAAPAAVRLSLPEANPAYYLTASLAITFPFNLAIGIPLYYAFSKYLFGS